MSFLRRGGRGVLVHEFTITAGLLAGYNYPNCGTSRYGYYSGFTGSITNSTFKIYTINKVFDESQYENDDFNFICTGVTNQYGHLTSFVFGLSGYTGTQLGAFRKIVCPDNTEYSAINAPYYLSGTWAWQVAGGTTTGTYKIYY